MCTELVITVLVAAAYPSVRAGLRLLIAEDPEIEVIGEWAGEEWTPENGGEHAAPDVILIDSDAGRIHLGDELVEMFPDAARVLLVEEADVYHELGPETSMPDAVLLKESEAGEIIAAIHAVSVGLIVFDPVVARAVITQPFHSPEASGIPGDLLTERESQVLQLLALGLPNKAIARELGISEHTAKFHVGSIMTKLDAASRTEAVAVAARRGLLVL